MTEDSLSPYFKGRGWGGVKRSPKKKQAGTLSPSRDTVQPVYLINGNYPLLQCQMWCQV